LNCFNLIERVLIKKIQSFEQNQDMSDIKEIQELEKEILNQIKTEAKTQKIDVEKLKEKEIDAETLEKYLNKANENSENEKKNTIESLIFLKDFLLIFISFFKKEDNLTPFDASQILLSFCKLKIVKPELFEILEAAFVKMLPIANPSSFTAFAFAHSSLCTEMQMKFYDNKKYLLRRSVKNLKFFL